MIAPRANDDTLRVAMIALRANEKVRYEKKQTAGI